MAAVAVGQYHISCLPGPQEHASKPAIAACRKHRSFVPDNYKCANVCPIFKKANRNLADNYRPVSITCQICKIFEEVIRDAFVHLESNCLIRDSQHGFIKGYSCLTNLLTFTLTFSTVRIMDSTVDKDALETGDWRALLVNKVVHYRL